MRCLIFTVVQSVILLPCLFFPTALAMKPDTDSAPVERDDYVSGTSAGQVINGNGRSITEELSVEGSSGAPGQTPARVTLKRGAREEVFPTVMEKQICFTRGNVRQQLMDDSFRNMNPGQANYTLRFATRDSKSVDFIASQSSLLSHSGLYNPHRARTLVQEDKHLLCTTKTCKHICYVFPRHSTTLE